MVYTIVPLMLFSCGSPEPKKEKTDPDHSLVVSREDMAAMKEHLISIAKARELEKTYVTTRYAWINERLKKEDTVYAKNGDTREYWFSLDVIKAYIAYIESNSPKGAKDLGIRIYSGAYPRNADWGKGQPGFSTVFLVPTIGRPGAGQGIAPMPPINKNQTDLQALNICQGGDPPKQL